MNVADEQTKWHLIWSRKYTPFVAVSYFLTFLKDTPIWAKCQNRLFIPEGGLHSYYFNSDELDKICKKFEKYILKQDIQIFCDRYEGGIACHAAIVAREMKKPCIIGTGRATKILKDGDLVEVDANNGIVNIIRRNNEKISK